MKKYSFLAFFAILSIQAFAQITFDPGYIVNENGTKTQVLIRLDESVTNPSKIQYKLSAEGEVHTAGPSSIREFGIGEDFKFVGQEVEIDRASEDFKKLTRDRNPDFEKETLFLRLLIEADYSLLAYKDGKLERFFIRKPSGETEQLIYKKYTTGDNIIRKNTQYRQQLHSLLICEDITIDYLMKVDYTRSELMKLFIKYNSCKESDYKVYFSRPKGELNVKVKAGMNFTYLGMEQVIYQMENDLGYSVQPRIGFEVEYIIPMLNRKFSLFTEPSLSIYKTEKELIVLNRSQYGLQTVTGVYRSNVELNYLDLELPVGMRFYMFLNDSNTSRLFLNGGASINFLVNSSKIPEDRNGESSEFTLDHSTKPYYFGGIGYSYQKRFSIEARYYPERQLTSNFAYTLHHNNSFAIIAGYTLF